MTEKGCVAKGQQSVKIYHGRYLVRIDEVSFCFCDDPRHADAGIS